MPLVRIGGTGTHAAPAAPANAMFGHSTPQGPWADTGACKQCAGHPALATAWDESRTRPCSNRAIAMPDMKNALHSYAVE